MRVLSCSVRSNSLQPHGLQTTRLLCPWDFSRQESWSELPFFPLGDLPVPGIEPTCPESPALAGGFFTTEPAGRPIVICIHCRNITQSIFTALKICALPVHLSYFPYPNSPMAGRFHITTQTHLSHKKNPPPELS